MLLCHREHMLFSLLCMTFPPSEALPFLEGGAQSYLQLGLFHPQTVSLTFRQEVLMATY